MEKEIRTIIFLFFFFKCKSCFVRSNNSVICPLCPFHIELLMEYNFSNLGDALLCNKATPVRFIYIQLLSALFPSNLSEGEALVVFKCFEQSNPCFKGNLTRKPRIKEYYSK